MATQANMQELTVPRKNLLGLSRERRIQLIVLVVGIVLWEIVGRRVGNFILAPPSTLVKAFFEMVASGELYHAAMDSIFGLIIGFLIALFVGVVLGFLMGWYKALALVLDPFVSAFYVVPIAALVPLLIIWMGIGASPRIACIALFAVFEILIATYTGVKNVDQRLIEMARSFGATRNTLFRKVVFFDALPMVFAGVRIGAGRAIKGMVVAELLFAVTGLGGLVMTYSVYYQTDKVMVVVVVLALIGVLLTSVVQWVERKLGPWALIKTE
jgi:ABC-type nitrate/sulfonate/bicarbonate transport system permease component